MISRLGSLAGNNAFWNTYIEADEGIPLFLANFRRLKEVTRVW